MAKAKNINMDQLLTAEQTVEHAPEGFSDLYFLAVPRQTLEELNAAASANYMTLAQVLSEALSLWMEKNGTP